MGNKIKGIAKIVVGATVAIGVSLATYIGGAKVVESGINDINKKATEDEREQTIKSDTTDDIKTE